MSNKRATRLLQSLPDVEQQATPAAAERSQQEAAELRWTYYKAHKSELIKDISLYREAILESLMRGASPDEAFAPYRHEVARTMSMSTAKAARGNAQGRWTAVHPQAPAAKARAQASQWIDGIFNPRRQAVLAQAVLSRKEE